MERSVGVPRSDVPARNQLGFSVQSRPRPNVAPTFALLLDAGILFLAADKLPNFVTLNALEVEIAENLVLILRTRPAQFDQQVLNRRAMRAGQPGRRTQRTPFNQTRNHLRLPFFTQYIHASNILD